MFVVISEAPKFVEKCIAHDIQALLGVFIKGGDLRGEGTLNSWGGGGAHTGCNS